MSIFNLSALKISHKLIGGFAAVVLLLAIAVGTTLWEVKGVKNLSDRIVNLRTPTAEASALLTSQIYASLASLRGWMLTGNAAFKAERASVWSDIARTRGKMDKLSKNWTNPKNVSAWGDFKATLEEFKAAQAKVEVIANSADEQPATKMLVNEAAPLAGVMIKNISKIIDIELAYEPDFGKKTTIVSQLRSDLGYGGMIHQFKNYVIRKDAGRIAKIQAKIEKVKEEIASYRTFGMTDAEMTALKGIEQVVNAYAKGVTAAKRLAAQGATAQQIDQAIKVSDGPALKGLGTLDAELAAAAVGKPRVLTMLRDAMGYGGMIHQFKNYVIREDAGRVKKIKAKLSAARKEIARYRTFGMTDAEKSALKGIEQVVNAYAAGLAKAEGLVSAGSTPEQIDKSVKVSDGPALKGLKTLAREITGQLGNLKLSAQNQSRTSADRLQLLGMMADVRGTLGLGLANIRAYLLTGDAKFVENFKKFWAKNERRFGDLKTYQYLMTKEQSRAFDVFAEKRAEFVPLPAKMFAIRGSKKWNMANYTLVKEAAPRAGKLLTALVGPKAKDGSRSGGMVANQKKLMLADAGTNAENISSLLTMQWILLALGLVSGGAIAFFTARSISTPLIRMTGAMQQLADGNLETEVPAQDRKDEIGDMSGAVQVFKDSAIRNKELEADQVRQKQIAEEEKRKAMNELADDFDAKVGGIVEAVSSASAELNTTAQSMASISEETSNQASSVAAASEQASANVQTVASATEEMTASISEINGQVAQASDVSKQAVENVEKTALQMEELAQTADKVGEVVSMISDIAEQTNLLALNATIESARAGEAGKGFAVVAAEVKTLANETAKATEDIAAHIQKIQSATKNAVTSIGDIGTVVKQLEETSTVIAAAMEEQGATTQEISRNVQEAASGTKEVTSSIAGVTQASQEAGAASGQVTSAAGELSQQAEMMKSEVRKFLEQVRAA